MTSTASILELTEQQSGLRLCKACNKLLPLNLFRSDKRKYTCIPHLRAAKRREVLGTHEKRAFNSLRCRARQDMLMFGHDKMVISRRLVTSLLSDEQMANFPKYCLIPRDPAEILSPDNILIVSTIQRAFVVGRWRDTHDNEQYKRDLDFILEAPKRNASQRV